MVASDVTERYQLAAYLLQMTMSVYVIPCVTSSTSCKLTTFTTRNYGISPFT
jgi:hypothetical protein